MKKIKKNNKGFSLVELIVVILIMAIIAVALAPQVIKWVDRSKRATDAQNYESLIAECQLALTDSAAYAEVTKNAVAGTPAKAMTVTIGTVTTVAADGTADSKGAFEAALTKLDAGWDDTAVKVTGETYTIFIMDNGSVTKGDKVPDTSNMEN